MTKQTTLETLLEKTDKWLHKRAKNRRIAKRGGALSIFKWGQPRYGFNESLKSGIYAPFPHEANGQTSCFPGAVMHYFMARHLNLNPRFFVAQGLTSDRSDVSPNPPYVAGHAFIDVEMNDGKRVMVDPFNATYGLVKYDLENKVIKVRDNSHTNHTRKKFSNLTELSFDEMVDQLMEWRTPEGMMDAISVNQRLPLEGFCKKSSSTFYRYDAQQDSLDVTVHLSYPVILNRGITQRFFLDRQADVMGSAYSFFFYAESGGGWSYTDRVDMGEFEASAIGPMMGVFNQVLLKKDSHESRHRKAHTTTLLDFLADNGISVLGIDETKLPPNVDRKEVEQAHSAFEKVVAEQYEGLKTRTVDFFATAERSMLVRELLRLTLAERKTAGEDHDGYVSTQEERDEHFRKRLARYDEVQKGYTDICTARFMKIAKLGDGPTTIAMKNHRARYSSEEGSVSELAQARGRHFQEYNEVLDYTLLSLDHGDTDVDELYRLVDEKGGDIINAYKGYVLEFALQAYQARRVLFDRKLAPKFLKKIKDYRQQQRVAQQIDELESTRPELVDGLREKFEDGLYDPVTVGVHLRKMEETVNKLLAS